MTEFTNGNLLDRNVLVVGGAGYIGTVLVRRLLTRGYRVTVLDNLIYGNGSSLAGLVENPRFSFIKGDFCKADTYRKDLMGITDVVLLAGLIGDPICKKYPNEAKRINFDGTIKFIEYISEFDQLRFIFMSTCSNYGLRESDTPA
jgi:nucleoside-diphosphate-sugar epimerase